MLEAILEFSQWTCIAFAVWYAGYVHSMLRKRTPTPTLRHDEPIVEQWRAEMAKYAEGSPRHTAFKNRLKELGYGD